MMPSDEEACAVCESDHATKRNLIIFCDGKDCNLPVHKECYGVGEIPEGDWYCQRCEQKRKQKPMKVICCPMQTGALKHTTTPGEFMHVVCAKWNKSIDDSISPYSLNKSQLGERTCYLCTKEQGLCIPCEDPVCTKYFHVTCGINSGLITAKKVVPSGYSPRCSLHQQASNATKKTRPGQRRRLLKKDMMDTSEDEESEEEESEEEDEASDDHEDDNDEDDDEDDMRSFSKSKKQTAPRGKRRATAAHVKRGNPIKLFLSDQSDSDDNMSSMQNKSVLATHRKMSTNGPQAREPGNGKRPDKPSRLANGNGSGSGSVSSSSSVSGSGSGNGTEEKKATAASLRAPVSELTREGKRLGDKTDNVAPMEVDRGAHRSSMSEGSRGPIKMLGKSPRESLHQKHLANLERAELAKAEKKVPKTNVNGSTLGPLDSPELGSNGPPAVPPAQPHKQKLPNKAHLMPNPSLALSRTGPGGTPPQHPATLGGAKRPSMSSHPNGQSIIKDIDEIENDIRLNSQQRWNSTPTTPTNQSQPIPYASSSTFDSGSSYPNRMDQRLVGDLRKPSIANPRSSIDVPMDFTDSQRSWLKSMLGEVLDEKMTSVQLQTANQEIQRLKEQLRRLEEFKKEVAHVFESLNVPVRNGLTPSDNVEHYVGELRSMLGRYGGVGAQDHARITEYVEGLVTGQHMPTLLP